MCGRFSRARQGLDYVVPFLPDAVYDDNIFRPSWNALVRWRAPVCGAGSPTATASYATRGHRLRNLVLAQRAGVLVLQESHPSGAICCSFTNAGDRYSRANGNLGGAALPIHGGATPFRANRSRNTRQEERRMELLAGHHK